MKQDFNLIAERAAKLRLTEKELVAMVQEPPLAWVTYWRSKTGITGLNGQVKVIRRVEALLNRLELIQKLEAHAFTEAVDKVRAVTNAEIFYGSPEA